LHWALRLLQTWHRTPTSQTPTSQTLGEVKPMSRKPVVRMAELEIDPDTLETYRALLTEEIETSIALEDGVLSLSAVSIRNNPNRIRILEVYADQEAY
jgi:hypothetical protein